MAVFKMNAYAKINLSLDVLGKRSDNLHSVKMIMQTIDLHDIVEIETTEGGIEISSNLSWLPTGPDNIAYKAAKRIFDLYKVPGGIRIRLEKRIPVAAGLAGGSTDAAAVLIGMNSLFSLNIPADEMNELGKFVGADVPFCIRGGTMLAEGIGEILTGLPQLPPLHIVLVKPPISVSTAWAYQNLKLESITFRPDTDMLIKAIADGNIEVLARNMKNVLELVTGARHNIIDDLKKRLMELGALGSMMSGSGAAVFGIFRDRQSAHAALEKIKGGKCESFYCTTRNKEN